MPVFQLKRECDRERVLVIAPVDQARALCTEALIRGAICRVAHDVVEASAEAAGGVHDVIVLAALHEVSATALMLRLLRAAQPRTSIYLLVDQAQAAALGDAALDADELLVASLSAARIVTATGIGLRTSSVQEHTLSA